MAILILGAGAAVVFFMLQSTGRVVEPTATATNTHTPTITFTPTTTYTPTMVVTSTPLAPIEYTVKDGDLCASIAALFGISIPSIVLENNLSSDCYLSPGQILKIPQPTPTVTPLPTGTLTGSEATLAACGSYDYVVANTDTLFGIALNFGVSTDIIREYNGLANDIVVAGSTIHIPLCERVTPGPTSTPTNPPPYEAPNLLLPADGASYNTSGETITLQWAGVGTLLDNEAYEINIEDITEGTGRKLIDYVKDTKYIVPISFRPSDPAPHAIKWYVQSVRQSGSQEDGSPIYVSAGARSDSRTFIWSGVAIQ
jgi:LysM repeat protein